MVDSHRILPLELTEVTHRVLRASHIPEGYAAGAARLIVYGEIYRGIGVAALHELINDTSYWTPRAARIVNESTTGLTLDAEAGNLLFVGPPLLDVVKAQLDTLRTSFTITVHNVYGHFQLLEQLAHASAAAGITTFLQSHSSRDFETVIGVPSEDGPFVIRRRSATPFRQLSDDHQTTFATELIERLLNDDLRVVAPPSQTSITITGAQISSTQTTTIIDQVIGNIQSDLWPRSPDVARQMEQDAYRRGMIVDDKQWKAIKSFCERILIPAADEVRRPHAWSKRTGRT